MLLYVAFSVFGCKVRTEPDMVISFDLPSSSIYYLLEFTFPFASNKFFVLHLYSSISIGIRTYMTYDRREGVSPMVD